MATDSGATAVSYYDDPRLSNSMLSTLAESPLKFYQTYIAKTFPSKETDAMRFGSLFHLMTMEQHKFHDEYVIEPKVDRRTKDGKERYAKFIEDCQGKTPVAFDDVELCERLAELLWSHDELSKLKGLPCDIETPIFFELEGVPFRCKPDAVYHDLKIILDYKTTKDASPYGFGSSAANFGYDRQAWIYKEALKQITGNEYRFLFAAIEKEPPHEFAVYELDHRAMFVACGSVLRLLDEYKRRMESGDWMSGWSRGVHRLELPVWVERSRDRE
jgi:exodeoxyribonuclease VIII